MTLDVDAPHPPDLTTAVSAGSAQGSPTVEHRADIEAMLHDSAWRGAFADWASHTDLSERDWSVVLDLDLIAEFDFRWDAHDNQIRYEAPAIPDDWQDRDLHPNLTDWATVSTINSGLDDLGQTVADLLEEEYIDWDTEDIERDEDRPL